MSFSNIYHNSYLLVCGSSNNRADRVISLSKERHQKYFFCLMRMFIQATLMTQCGATVVPVNRLKDC